MHSWIEHHAYNVCFFYRMLYMRFEKNVRLLHGMRNMHFTIYIEKPYTYILQHMHYM